MVRDWRGPSRSLVSKDRRYKPVVKAGGAQRESDGAVVPGRAAPARGPGTGPGFGHAGDGGKREGMAGTAQPNYPDGHMPAAKVRQLQNRLWAAAKQSKGRRFHALYDRAYRSDVLWEAWGRVSANRGAAGVDGLTLSAVEAYGAERMLAELQEALRTGNYRPAPVRRVFVPKPDSTSRPLGNPRLRTGNAGTKFVSLDNYVWWRLLRLMVKKRGRNLHAGQADRWDSAWFHDQGLYKLMGTIRYPKAA